MLHSVADSVRGGVVKAEGLLLTRGRNKACAPLAEPVAAVVTREERCRSRETVCGQTAAVTQHTAAGSRY